MDDWITEDTIIGKHIRTVQDDAMILAAGALMVGVMYIVGFIL